MTYLLAYGISNGFLIYAYHIPIQILAIEWLHNFDLWKQLYSGDIDQ